jgi:hypothetical protein
VQAGLVQLGWVMVAAAVAVLLVYALVLGWNLVAAQARRAAARPRTVATPGRWPSGSPS